MPDAAGDGRSARPSRPTDATRRALMGAAIVVFAERGYEAASVRDITGKAKVNQGAITYHFGGKSGLYLEVLRSVRESMSAQPLLSLATLDVFPPEEALHLFILQTLMPLAESARFKRSLRIFAWEQLKPTAIRQKLSREEPFPTVMLAQAVVRRFMPTAGDRRIAIAAAWLMGQTITFVRDAEWLAAAPFGLRFDRAGVEDLADGLTALALGGLANL